MCKVPQPDLRVCPRLAVPVETFEPRSNELVRGSGLCPYESGESLRRSTKVSRPAGQPPVVFASITAAKGEALPCSAGRLLGSETVVV